ncbi:MAG: TetR/AcrR family transcriptional regulator [Actinomycetota bacterium]
MPAISKSLTARQRAHAEITSEIKAIARRQLGEVGPAALSLRAVARELGLASASGLYRYFDGRDALFTALIIDAYSALGDQAEQAYAKSRTKDVFLRWIGIAHAVHDWGMANPHEYALIFGTPIPGYAAPPDTIGPATKIPLLVGQLFRDVAADSSRLGEYAVVPRRVHKALQPLLDTLAPGVPDELLIRSLMAWTYLLGAVSFDVFGHRDFLGQDDVFFDAEIRRLGTMLGLAPPGRPVPSTS